MTAYVATTKDIYGGKRPEELPAYPLPRAAQLLHVSPSTLRSWSVGAAKSSALFTPAQRAPLTLSFSNLVEGFVLASMRRTHHVPMQQVRKALRFVAEELEVERPLVHAKFRTDGVKLFVENAGRLLSVSDAGQVVLQKTLEASLARIEWHNDLAARLFPWVREGAHENDPKNVVLDPRLGFGQPVIAGTGIATRVVASRYLAGESVAALATDYRVTTEQVEDAIRCETRDAA
jgi:uncharacterized protein (DUF433 family)